MAGKKLSFAGADKIGNHLQVGGIETSVLDDGPGRGLRVAWINTGTPLRYKVVIDRGLDIAEAFYGEHSLAWLSRGGVCGSRSAATTGLEWLYGFGGGLLTTCGLRHVGGPEEDAGESFGLHGRYSNLAGRVESIIQPDPTLGKMDMSITGIVEESRVFGPHLQLRRTISGRLGEPVIRIRDEVVNRANTPVEHMILYHINFGWPLVDEGAKLLWAGAWQSFGREQDNSIFRDGVDVKRCSGVLSEHSGSGEACCYVDMKADKKGICQAGVVNDKLGLGSLITFKKKQLPWLTNWQHWGQNEYVTALEPCSCPPFGREKARKEKALVCIRPGGKRVYELEIAAFKKA